MHHFLKPLLPYSNLYPDWYTCGYHGKAQNLVTEQWWEEGHVEEHAMYQLNKRDQIQAAFTSLSLVSISVNLRITRCSYSILSLFKKVTVKNHFFYLLQVQRNAHSRYLGNSQQARVEPQGAQGFSPGPVVSFPWWSSELCKLEGLWTPKGVSVSEILVASCWSPDKLQGPYTGLLSIGLWDDCLQ